MKRPVKYSLIGLVVLALVFGGYLYSTQANRAVPAPEAVAALVSDERVTVDDGQYVVFRPTGVTPTTGVIFYPGAACDPRGYAPVLRRVAERGYLVVSVPMPLDMAIFAPGRKGRLLFIRQHHRLQDVCAPEDGPNLVGAGKGNLRVAQGPLKDVDNAVAGDQTDHHADAEGGDRLDENPAEILQMIEEGFYRPAFIDHLLVSTWIVGVSRHDWCSGETELRPCSRAKAAGCQRAWAATAARCDGGSSSGCRPWPC